MTEILTESYCERCGTRYTFETARPRNSRIGRAKTFTKGLRNYVLSDDSFSEAMADARGEEELQATVVQLDAFHKTFNFCLDCRQYTCGNCWNTDDGRCLSCAPRPELEQVEPLESATTAAIANRLAAIAGSPVDAAPEAPVIGIAAWPASDLPPEPVAAIEAPVEELAEVEAGALAGAGAIAPEERSALAPIAESLLGAAVVESALDAVATPVAEPEPVVEPEAAVAARAAHPAPQGLEPGETIEAAIAAYEAAHLLKDAPAEPVAEPEPLAGPVAAPEPEPVATVAEPEPVAAVAEPEPVGAPEPEPEPVLMAEPAAEPAPIAATAEPASMAPGWLTVAPDDGSAPAWPQRPSWPTATRPPMEAGTLAGRKLMSADKAADLWAASAREVIQGGPVGGGGTVAGPAAVATAQPCVGCGLSLSANARFCRRCGARQS